MNNGFGVGSRPSLMTPELTIAADVAVAFDEISKIYPPDTIALDRVSVSVAQGAIHAFVGENGAGKSTLMKVLSGETRPDSGRLFVKGCEARYNSPADAMTDGVGIVHQEILLVGELTVWENIVLGNEPMKRGPFGLRRIDREAARSSVKASIESYGLGLDVDAVVGDLTVASRQKVEICKLLYRNTDVIVLDEPTAILAPQEVPALFDELRRLRDSGCTICFISHHLDEVLELCDTVTVLRGGTLIKTVRTRDTTAAELARLMVERDVTFDHDRLAKIDGPEVLKIENLAWSTPGVAATLGPLTVCVHGGEILGVAGVDGNGQALLVDCIVGARKVSGGRITIGDADCTNLGVLDRRRLIAYVPAERKSAGSALEASVVENLAMTHHRLTGRFSRTLGRLRFLNRTVMRVEAEKIRDDFDVAVHSVDSAMATLSGGNQQKVILGRELLEKRPVVILDQPTRGLDVGSIEFVHSRILRMRAEGQAVLLISADLDEIERLSDRVVVMHRGRIALDAPILSTSREAIGRAMLEGAL